MSLKTLLNRLLSPSGADASPLDRLTAAELRERERLYVANISEVDAEIIKLRDLHARHTAEAAIGGAGALSIDAVETERRNLADTQQAREVLGLALDGVRAEIGKRKETAVVDRVAAKRKALRAKVTEYLKRLQYVDNDLRTLGVNLTNANAARNDFLMELPPRYRDRFDPLRRDVFMLDMNAQLAARTDRMLGGANPLIPLHEIAATTLTDKTAPYASMLDAVELTEEDCNA